MQARAEALKVLMWQWWRRWRSSATFQSVIGRGGGGRRGGLLVRTSSAIGRQFPASHVLRRAAQVLRRTTHILRRTTHYNRFGTHTNTHRDGRTVFFFFLFCFHLFLHRSTLGRSVLHRNHDGISSCLIVLGRAVIFLTEMTQFPLILTLKAQILTDF